MVKVIFTGILKKIEFENNQIIRFIVKDDKVDSKKFVTVTLFKTKDESYVNLIKKSIGDSVVVDGQYYEVLYPLDGDFIHEHIIRCVNITISAKQNKSF